MKIDHYQTLVFDCDGVLLNSNVVKTRAFYAVALSHGKAAAQSLVDFHVSHGGISRYKKFEHFLVNILGHKTVCQITLNILLQDYADAVWNGLLTCEIANGLEDLRARTLRARWLVVSGGDQEELRRVFQHRGLREIFDGGIFGSPRTKDEILDCEIRCGNVTKPAIFFGDSKYDHEAASRSNIDFLFMSAWSEFHDWEKYCEENSVPTIECISSL